MGVTTGMNAIYLIRHAETELNRSRVVQFPDTPLNPEGRWQADRLAARLGPLGVSRIVSSDYVRARATAERIRDATAAPLSVTTRLRERDLGTLRGRPYAEVREQVFGEGFDPPAGEAWDAFVRRVDALWRWIGQVGRKVEGALVVVTHGLVCRALARRHLTFDPTEHPMRFPNASLTIIGSTPPWRVEVLASDSHLHPRRRKTPDALVRIDRPRPT
jgi:2,3-bisphosphoglycerate-dependent phosphoglycerate mutase